MKEETNNPESGGQPAEAEDSATPKRDEEATSSETLSDLEESAKVTGGTGGSTTSDAPGSASSNTPSPDGQFDSERGGGDPAGPM